MKPLRPKSDRSTLGTVRAARRRGFGRFARDTRGSAAVEFALVVWPFLLIVFATLQISLIVFMNQILQTAAVQAGRYYMTGQAAGLSQANFQSYVDSLLPPGLFYSPALLVDVQVAGSASALPETPLTYGCTYNAQHQCTVTQGAYTASVPQEYVILRVEYELPLMGGGFGFSNQSNGSYLMAGTSVFAVEPYPLS